MIYGIFTPLSEAPVAVMYSEERPTLEQMGDHVAAVLAFRDRDALLAANPNISLLCLALN